MIILGLDPGYAIVGYGVVRADSGRYRSLEHGAIVTKAGQPFERRLEIIYDALSSVLEKWKPESMALEKLFFSNNKTTAIGVAEARGVILLAAQKAPGHGDDPAPLVFAGDSQAGRYRRCVGYGYLSRPGGGVCPAEKPASAGLIGRSYLCFIV